MRFEKKCFLSIACFLVSIRLIKLLKYSKDLEGDWRIITQAHSKEENHGNMDMIYSKIYERICEDFVRICIL